MFFFAHPSLSLSSFSSLSLSLSLSTYFSSNHPLSGSLKTGLSTWNSRYDRRSMQDAYDERHNHTRQGMLWHIWFDYLHVYPLVSDVSLELASIVLCMFSRYLRRLSIDIKFKVFSLFTISFQYPPLFSRIWAPSTDWLLLSTLCHILSICLSLSLVLPSLDSLSLYLHVRASLSCTHSSSHVDVQVRTAHTHMSKSHQMRRYRSLTLMHTHTRRERVHGNDVHSGKQQQPQAHSL
jgi:hypothetical protein